MLEYTLFGKAREAFKDKTAQEFGPKYLELLYANWFEIMRSARRAVFLAVLLALSFFLLDPSGDSTLKLGPLETSNIGVVQVLLPAITSFLLFEAIDLTLTAVHYHEASRAVMRELYPDISKNDFELFLEPPTTFAWGGGSFTTAHPQAEGKLADLLRSATTVSVLLVWGASLAFLGYAYITLFEHSDVNCAVLIASLVFTLFNVFRAAIQIAIVFEDFDLDDPDE